MGYQAATSYRRTARGEGLRCDLVAVSDIVEGIAHGEEQESFGGRFAVALSS